MTIVWDGCVGRTLLSVAFDLFAQTKRKSHGQQRPPHKGLLVVSISMTSRM